MEYLIYVLVGLGGVVAHSLIKFKSLATDFEKANTHLSPLEYLKIDFVAISLSVLSVFLWLALFGEAALRYPKIADYTRFSFFAMGGIGSYAIQLVFSRAKKKLRDIVDEKTNIADNLTDQTMNKTVFWTIPPAQFGYQVTHIAGVPVQGYYTVQTLPTYDSNFGFAQEDGSTTMVLTHDSLMPLTITLSPGQGTISATSTTCNWNGTRPVRPPR